MIDPAISLALSVYSNKGVYALLLGSGASRSSGIPTGWEVTLDLVKKVACLHGDNCDADPEAWYVSKYGKAPLYSDLLQQIASTQVERQRLLRTYFEPSEDELKRGMKSPTGAHIAIAQLVKAGHVKVIITTNFDRLVEKALEQVGVTPAVISTPDQLKGALPIQHAEVTVIKVNGDYLDTRLRNTEEELEQYDEHFDSLLGSIFNDYGLIVSGWSADWDAGLVRIIERSGSRRFPFYWTTQGSPGERAVRLIGQKAGTVISVKDADTFFEQLNTRIAALCDMNAEHPVSARLAASSVKNHLSSPGGLIRLHDLVADEREKLFERINSQQFKPDCSGDVVAEIGKRVSDYRRLSDIMLNMVATGCYWGRPDTDKIWIDAIRRICTTESQSGTTALINLKRYPGLLVLYAACIGGIAGGNIKSVSRILAQTKVRCHSSGKDESIFVQMLPGTIIENDVVKKACPELSRWTYAASVLLHRELRDVFSSLIPDGEVYSQHFDFLEYLLCLLYVDCGGEDWIPQGHFTVRRRHSHNENQIWSKFEEQMMEQGSEWGLLTGGLFGGSIDRLSAAKNKYDALLAEIPRY